MLRYGGVRPLVAQRGPPPATIAAMVGDPSRPASPPGAPPPGGGPPGGGGGDAPSTRRVLLGELLVESKVITPEQLGEVLASPREGGKKLGQILLERGWIT